MKFIQTLAVYLLLGVTTAVTAEDAVRYRFYKDVDRGTSTAEEILALVLDSDVYAATRNGLPDLRIFDLSKGDAPVEAPYQIEPEVELRTQRIRQSWPTEVISLREVGNNIEIRLKLKDKSPAAEGFGFVTPLKDFECKVLVEGSDDGENWTPLLSDGMIFDYSRFMNVSNHDVALPSNSFRQFKITVKDVTDERESPYKELTRTMRGGEEKQRDERIGVERRPLRINRIDLVYYLTQEHVERVKKAEYPIVKFLTEQDAQKKQTIIEVATRREPLTSFSIETTSRNFNRLASVQVPTVVHGQGRLQPDRTEWRDIGSATVSKIQLRNFKREELSVKFPEHREEKYRIVIDNEDNPPLEIKDVQTEGNVYRVVFLAQEGKPYRVFYGSEKAETPKYEAATVLATLRKGFQPVEVRLGGQTDNTTFAGEPEPLLRKLLNNWIFLGAAIVLMVAVLGWGLFYAGQHLEQMPKE